MYCCPFVGYYNEQNFLNSISYCVLLDYLDLNTSVVHVFIYGMVQSFKLLLPQVSHVHYFSSMLHFNTRISIF